MTRFKDIFYGSFVLVALWAEIIALGTLLSWSR